MKLIKKRKQEDKAKVEGLKYGKITSGVIGRSFFASVYDGIDKNSQEVEVGEVQELTATVFAPINGALLEH